MIGVFWRSVCPRMLLWWGKYSVLFWQDFFFQRSSGIDYNNYTSTKQTIYLYTIYIIHSAVKGYYRHMHIPTTIFFAMKFIRFNQQIICIQYYVLLFDGRNPAPQTACIWVHFTHLGFPWKGYSPSPPQKKRQISQNWVTILYRDVSYLKNKSVLGIGFSPQNFNHRYRWDG